MVDDARSTLQSYLVKRYADLKQSLARRLRNDELASDALQDTWLRVQRMNDHTLIQSPRAYLIRMAGNIAVDIQRSQARMLTAEQIDDLLELPDPAPDLQTVVESRREMDMLLEIMQTLPARRREVLILVRWEGMPQKEVAKLMGISLRVVEYELKCAHDYCIAQMTERSIHETS